MIKKFKNFLAGIFLIFKKKKHIRLGIYGPPNAGKTSLANKICKDWLGEEMGKVSPIPHETREIQQKEKVTVNSNGKKLSFNLIDTPGIATRIDYEDFIKKEIGRASCRERV